ncbi:hypothetical protein P8452_75305 [Trifolium repens]|nr:protein PHYTOCHROME KINASE SUBSTRATE [Trifolium repens]WJX93817.1 hypothetical protein P8452_75305 [Trifolium repens]
MFTLSSTSKTSLHQIQTFNTQNNNLHDTIFSPYLNIKEGNYIGKNGESSQIINPFINHRNSPLHQVEKTEEIGVFGAEKYFNRREVDTPRVAKKYRPQRDESMAIETRKYQVEYGTPSISSVSTWNSQSALLKSEVRNSLRNSKEKVHAKSVLSCLGLKCSCSDKNSVDISDHAGEISFNKKTSNVQGKSTPKKVFNLGLDNDLSVKIRKPSSEVFINKDVYFQKQEKLRVGGLNSEKNSFASNSRNHLVKMPSPSLDEVKTPRKSLEVFGSPNPILINNKISSLSINDKRLIFHSKMEEIDSNYVDDNDDDAASDASSDLFEIESLKGKSSNNFLTRQTSDAASSCVSPNNYAPSEASIEWSVVTASAAVMSDCEDQMSEFTIRSPIKTPMKPKITRETQRRRPGTLLGCKSHKAVRVAGDAFITYEKQSLSPKIGNRNKNNTNSQVARFPGETNICAKTRHGQQHGYTTPPLLASNSPHASKLLYI